MLQKFERVYDYFDELFEVRVATASPTGQRIAVINIIPLEFYGLLYDMPDMINCLSTKLFLFSNKSHHVIILVITNFLGVKERGCLFTLCR